MHDLDPKGFQEELRALPEEQLTLLYLASDMLSPSDVDEVDREMQRRRLKINEDGEVLREGENPE